MAVKRSTPRWRAVLGRSVAVGLACSLVWFAIEGGEFGTRELLQQRSRRSALELDIQQLQRDVDSLEREKTLVLKSDAVLERIAREQYGMLRGDKEILFWVTDERSAADSTVLPDTLSKR